MELAMVFSSRYRSNSGPEPHEAWYSSCAMPMQAMKKAATRATGMPTGKSTLPPAARAPCAGSSADSAMASALPRQHRPRRHSATH